jgi:hypothetical protein
VILRDGTFKARYPYIKWNPSAQACEKSIFLKLQSTFYKTPILKWKHQDWQRITYKMNWKRHLSENATDPCLSKET